MKQYTVMIIDESAEWRRQLADILDEEDMFLMVGEASDSKEASGFVATTTPDIIILDVAMRGRGGVILLRMLRSRLPGYHPIIYAMTGNDTAAYKEVAAELQIDCYSMKPIQAQYVISNLKKVIRKRGEGFLSDTGDSDQMIELVELALRNLGIPLHLKSTQTTVKTMEYIYTRQYAKGNKASNMRGMCNEVALKYGSTYSQIEKSLRSSARQMESKGTKTFQKVFEIEIDSDSGITSASFVSRVCRYIDQLVAERKNTVNG